MVFQAFAFQQYKTSCLAPSTQNGEKTALKVGVNLCHILLHKSIICEPTGGRRCEYFLYLLGDLRYGMYFFNPGSGVWTVPTIKVTKNMHLMHGIKIMKMWNTHKILHCKKIYTEACQYLYIKVMLCIWQHEILCTLMSEFLTWNISAFLNEINV